MKPFKLNTIDSLQVRQATDADLHGIEHVYKSNDETLDWLQYKAPLEVARSFIKNSDLPPHGIQENSINLVLISSDQEVIGVLNYYCGYPTETDIYIGDLFFSKSQQGKGFGKKVVEEFEKAAKANSYKRIYANLGLKNWPAIKFWTRRGYRNIAKIAGDSQYSPTSNASLEVFKLLS